MVLLVRHKSKSYSIGVVYVELCGWLNILNSSPNPLSQL